MSSVFWLPVPGTNGKLAELRARCEICRLSATSVSLEVWAKNGETVRLCSACANDKHTWEHLVDEGWHRR